MAKAARAIIIEDGKLLVMRRIKNSGEYYTLVGGQVDPSERLEQALIREVREETGLEVIRAIPVFYEPHPEPYNEQYIYLCEVAPHGDIKIGEQSEEALLNRLQIDTHEPIWISAESFPHLTFRTTQLQTAIANALKKGFPKKPIKLQ